MASSSLPEEMQQAHKKHAKTQKEVARQKGGHRKRNTSGEEKSLNKFQRGIEERRRIEK